MATKNLGLHEYSTAETGAEWCDALNSDNARVDGLPHVLESGSNSQLCYQKYSDGTLHAWGCIEYGTKYPCFSQVARGYSSALVTISFPVRFADTGYSLVAHVAASAYPDTMVAVSARSLDSVKLNFVCPINDSGASNSKSLSVDMWGRWR